MSVLSSELIAYGCANHAEDDSGAQGGAIDLTKKIAMTLMAATDDLEVLSSDVGDTTQTLTITGRLVGGAVDTEVLALNGTSVVTGTKQFERVLKAVLSASTTGTVTLRRQPTGATVATLEPGITEVRTLFFDAASDPSPKTLYEKFFFKNTNATDTLTNAALELTLEPAASADFLMAVEDAVDDTNSAANRVTAPVGQSAFRQLNVSEPVPGGQLLAGEAIGVWIQMDLAADNAGFVDDWSVELSGTTT